MVYLKLAWRNIIKNKRRSFITLSAISFGLALLILFQGFIDGVNRQWIENTIISGLGHIQIHLRGYEEEPSLEKLITNPQDILQILENIPSIEAVAMRLSTGGLISAPLKSKGCIILGIEPEKEKAINIVDENMIEGEYLAVTDTGYILLGERLARSLDVILGEKVVLLTQAYDGSLGAEAYRVKGIFRTGAPQLDRVSALITLPSFRKLTLVDGITGIVVLLKDGNRLDSALDRIKKNLIDSGKETLEVLSWRELQPALWLAIRIREYFSLIIAVIVYTIAAFGILNTILMSVMERVREMGLMMAMGVKPRSIVFLILSEAIILSILGVVGGVIIGIPSLIFLIQKGISVPGLGEMAQEFNINMGNYIYPALVPSHIFNLIILIIFIAVLSALYPAFKASKLNPADALRYV